MSRPLIAITRPSKSRKLIDACLWVSVFLGGGRPFLLKPHHDYKHVKFDGLLISGGTDVHPHEFGGRPKKNYSYDKARDALEKTMFKRAEDAARPILGICRGAQLMNVVRGGTLVMDITHQLKCQNYPENNFKKIFFRKPIKLNRHSLIHQLFGHDHVQVNSFHTQCVKELGAGFKGTARERVHIIQAIEDSKKQILGVQFHPEFMFYRRDCRRVFKWLCDKAKHPHIKTP